MISGTLATHDGLLHWLVRCDLSSASIAPDSSPDYLSTEEIKLWKSLRTDKRRRDWLLGRSTAKQLIADMLRERIDRKLPLDEITIRPHADGWPMVELPPLDGLMPVTLSISHSHDWAFCAAVAGENRPLGADIEFNERRSAAFAEEYFTPPEIQLLSAAPAEQRDTLTNAIWSGKESALKAVRRGLAEDTRLVSCLPHPLKHEPSIWLPMRIIWNGNSPTRPELTGLWRPHSEFVLTLAVADSISLYSGSKP
ncbi:MAG: 4'-phosphopantetheinyl transferase superfamily protein [Anaerolineales bacterium]|uniref:4'-phosphopantetheinyl transferase family protein n=1 Tax=Promineifilum sp. TaxID=2664178 RepID=UPI001D9CF2C5|nr:4'-phosphopantetheinyl transferase superfamily protein [Anaerolineales bacterium]MCB8936511.1 4'-phosphopantetheinyl transferase superfamily protein [Promineifilum sp.]MCO5182244.1 4'-phosphopantetheinyl transferase superfamily protein [Promineifilum sp.]